MHRHQQGLTLIELMIAMALGMGVVLAAVALMQAARSTYLSVADSAQVQENGRYALDLMARTVRQANYVPQDNPAFLRNDLGGLEPGVFGIDNARVSEHSTGLSSPSANRDAHGSDLLAIRFFGSGPRNQPDNDMLNCAGFAVPGPNGATSLSDLEEVRGLSIFYVAPDSTGEPELRCKYFTRDGGWSAAAIVRGVESFQVLYGVRNVNNIGGDLDYMSATRIDKRWRDVAAIRIALLARGERNVRDGGTALVHRLFGAAYQDGGDAGAMIDEARLPPLVQQRTRKVFQTTIWLRNSAP
ncbi:PilW family protein [Herbaspirillum sp. NPDC101397]|uniref:PilW family protein n=1 Tax=Herbaspirillum sp. NPDC101397 TaxID=3364006 RepID=UPI00383B8731